MTNKYDTLLGTLNNLIVSEDMVNESISEVIKTLKEYGDRVKSSHSCFKDGDELGLVFLDIVEGAYKLEHNRFKAMSAQRQAISGQIENLYKLLGKLGDPLTDPNDPNPCQSCRRPLRSDYHLHAPYRDCVGCMHYVDPTEDLTAIAPILTGMRKRINI